MSYSQKFNEILVRIFFHENRCWKVSERISVLQLKTSKSKEKQSTILPQEHPTCPTAQIYDKTILTMPLFIQ